MDLSSITQRVGMGYYGSDYSSFTDVKKYLNIYYKLENIIMINSFVFYIGHSIDI